VLQHLGAGVDTEAATVCLYVQQHSANRLQGLGKRIFKIDAVSAFRWKIEFSFSFSFRVFILFFSRRQSVAFLWVC